MNSEESNYISVKNFYTHNKKSLKLVTKKYDNMNKLKTVEIDHFMNALKVIMEIDEYVEQFSQNDIESTNDLNDDLSELEAMEKELESLETDNVKLHKQNKRLRKGLKSTKADIKEVKINTAELKQEVYKLNIQSKLLSESQSQKDIFDNKKEAHKRLMYRVNRYGSKSVDVDKMMMFQ